MSNSDRLSELKTSLLLGVSSRQGPVWPSHGQNHTPMLYPVKWASLHIQWPKSFTSRTLLLSLKQEMLSCTLMIAMRKQQKESCSPSGKGGIIIISKELLECVCMIFQSRTTNLVNHVSFAMTWKLLSNYFKCCSPTWTYILSRTIIYFSKKIVNKVTGQYKMTITSFQDT